jgi:hypothetical protein
MRSAPSVAVPDGWVRMWVEGGSGSTFCVTRVLQGCYKSVKRVLQERYKGSSAKRAGEEVGRRRKWQHLVCSMVLL